MQREAKKYLYDINESITSIKEYLGDIYDFNTYLNNKLLRRGIEREPGIIGEAMSKLLKVKVTLKFQIQDGLLT
jgi:uncharacterized protein with HEPN domain